MITASVVLYNNDRAVIEKTINSLFNYKAGFTLYLIDNSPSDALKVLNTHSNIVYVSNPTNPGFGAGHNIAIDMAIKSGSSYHFVVNPDIYFNDDVMSAMIAYMSADPTIGMLMPGILYPDGRDQNLPKLLPRPASIILRKLKFPKKVYQQFIDQYELRWVGRNEIYNAPILSGCFTLLNLKAINEVGMYDDRFFMYFEDWDLSRRVHEKYKTIYFPHVSVYHEYHSGANKSYRLFKVFLRSAVHYFNKWGWFSDSKRDLINAQTLAQFKK